VQNVVAPEAVIDAVGKLQPEQPTAQDGSAKSTDVETPSVALFAPAPEP